MSETPPPSYNPEQVLSLEKTLNAHVLGQEHAAKQVAKVLLNSAAGFREEEKPRGIFLFTGPTGVGKTEMALTLAKPDVFYPSSDSMYQPGHRIINMGEYQHSHEVAKLMGSPPGYLGHRETQPVMDLVSARPRTVFVLDEIEKAHPEIFDALLGPFDKGKMTTGDNRTLDFNHALFVLTSNHPAPDKVLRQEFLNRMDAIIKFNPLEKKHYKQLIERALHERSTTMIERYGVALGMDAKEIDRFAGLLAKQAASRTKGGPSNRIGFVSEIQRARDALNPVVVDSGHEIQPGTGARELKRILAKSLEPVTRTLLEGKWKVLPDSPSPNQIVIRDLFDFHADVEDPGGKTIGTITEPRATARFAASVGRSPSERQR